MHSPFSDSEAAPLQQPQTDNDASGSLQRVAVRPPLPSVWVTVLYLTRQDALGRPLQYRIEAMKKINAGSRSQKNHGQRPCAMRRGSHVASPLGRFDNSPFEYNGRFLRATSHDVFPAPRVPRGDVVNLSLLLRSGI